MSILHVPRHRLIPLLALAILLDLFPLAVAFMEPVPVASVFDTPEIGQHMMIAADNDPYRVYSVRRELLDHIIVANRLEAVEGLNSFQFAPYSRFMRLASGCVLDGVVAAVPPCASNEIDAEAYRDAVPDPTLLGLLNVGYVITGFPLDPQPELRQIAVTDAHYLYENTAVLPRAFAVGRAEAVSSDNLWTRLPEINPQQVALLEREQGLDFMLPDNDFYVAATHIERSPNHITIDIETPANGILVISEVWVPGWQASINGQPMPVLRVDGALRGVYLPWGRHQVRLDFMPPGLVAGLVLLVLTILGCLIAFAAAGWRTFR